MKDLRYAIVVGASSGIGREIALSLARRGVRVAAIARREDRLKELAEKHPTQIVPVVHDVRAVDDVPALFQDVCLRLGGLDLIVYASGVMPPMEADEWNWEKDASMIHVNVAGAVAWLNQAGERFQGTGHGCILGIGSVAGDRGRRKQPVYNASKAFLHTYLEALRNRLARNGVSVVTIKPGPTDTEMTSGLNLKGMMPADVAAEKILSLVGTQREAYLSWKYLVIFAIVRRLPSWIFRRLNL